MAMERSVYMSGRRPFNCLRKMVNGAAMASQPVALDADAAAKGKGHAADYGAVERCERQLLLLSR